VLSQHLNTRGRLEYSGRAEGTWAKPNLAGHLNGSELAIKHLPSGVNLDAGKLAAHLEGDTLWIDEFTGKSGDGRLRAAGHARLAASPMLQLHVEGENLALLEHPDWNLDANLKGDLRLDAQGTAVDGEIRLNRSLMLLGGADAPTLSPDVRIKGRATQRASTAAPGLRLAVRLDLGDDCHIRSSDKGQLLGGRLPFQTSGLRAKITGAVHLDSAPGKPLSARGELKIADGHYYLLGQRLDIERGNVLFNGPLLDPVLDIEAVRETPRMKAGLGISGRARNPHTRLFSEPDVPDQEKLSWLLFGRGGQPVDSGISGTTGIATRLSSFGLQLTDKLYVAYEQGASGTENFVNFYSQLTDKLSVEARTGQESRLRLFYTFSLDSAE
jgi:translocation and assembly module TamB